VGLFNEGLGRIREQKNREAPNGDEGGNNKSSIGITFQRVTKGGPRGGARIEKKHAEGDKRRNCLCRTESNSILGHLDSACGQCLKI